MMRSLQCRERWHKLSFVEVLIIISLSIIGFGFVIIYTSDFYTKSNIIFEKQRLSIFLEKFRIEAKRTLSDQYVYYNPETKKFVSSDGIYIVLDNIVKRDNLVLKYNSQGRVAILKGSSTIKFSDNTEFKILPVTGRIVF